MRCRRRRRLKIVNQVDHYYREVVVVVRQRTEL